MPRVAPSRSHDWEPRASAPVLRPGEVHIWRWRLGEQRADIDELDNYLDQEERRRAHQFHFFRDREHFIVSHGILRLILGSYLGMLPDHVQFLYGTFGKPELDPQSCPSYLSFNISHSAGLALLAVTTGAQVGIDVERIRLDMAYEEIVAQFFSAREIAMLRALPVEMRAEAFFYGWTRKEAYIKAKGYGLSLPLDRFTVSLDPTAAELLDVADDPRDRERWLLHSLIPGAGYAAALAVNEPGATMLYCDAWNST